MSESENDEDETEDVEDEEAEGIQEGDFVRLEYTARIDDEDEGETVIDTTDRELAEEEGLETEGREFGPRTIVVGEGHLFEEVEDDLIGEDVGYSNTVVVPSEEAFGEHDPDDVKTVSAQKLDEDDRYPGAQVEVDGQHGYVETIIGGRARIDFNHPLAGEDVEYEFEVDAVVDDEIEQAEALVELNAGASVEVSRGTETKTEVRVETSEDDEGEEVKEEVEEEVEVEVFYIEATPELSMNQQWMFGKQQVVDDLMHRFDVDRVVVRETFDHDDVHGGMPGMGGMGLGGMGGEVDAEDVDAEDIEEMVEEIE